MKPLRGEQDVRPGRLGFSPGCGATLLAVLAPVCRLLVLGLAVAALPGCAYPIVRERDSLACTHCYRHQEITRTYVLSLKVRNAVGEITSNRYSDVYDKNIEDPESPHRHAWLPEELTAERVNWIGRRHLATTRVPEPLRTLYAIQIVDDCAAAAPELGREVYRAIIRDYGHRDMRSFMRLSDLSQAVSKARPSGDAVEYWETWWKRHKRDYAARSQPGPAPKRYIPKPTRYLGPSDPPATGVVPPVRPPGPETP